MVITIVITKDRVSVTTNIVAMKHLMLTRFTCHILYIMTTTIVTKDGVSVTMDIVIVDTLWWQLNLLTKKRFFVMRS